MSTSKYQVVGLRGKSAYEIACAGGYTGTEEKFYKNMADTAERSALENIAVKKTTEKAAFHHITDSANYRVLDFGMERENTTCKPVAVSLG